MLIEYVGPDTEGVIIAASGQLAPLNFPIEVEDSLAASLLEQTDSWRAATVPADPSTPTAPEPVAAEEAPSGA